MEVEIYCGIRYVDCLKFVLISKVKIVLVLLTVVCVRYLPVVPVFFGVEISKCSGDVTVVVISVLSA